MAEIRVIEVKESVFANNDARAQLLREELKQEKTFLLNLMSSPGSGKTTLMKNIINRFGDMVTVLSHDNYYRRRDELTYEERCQINYDEPAAFDTELMVQQLDA